MFKLSTFDRLLTVLGFLMACGALYWLLTTHHRYPEFLPRVGYVSAVFCALLVLSFCWATVVADLALKKGWSPRTCIKAGVPLGLLVLVWAAFDSRFWLLAPLVGLINSFAGFFARRFAYPDLTDEQAAAPEPPLTLFQK
jgi:hypothetical protein